MPSGALSSILTTFRASSKSRDKNSSTCQDLGRAGRNVAPHRFQVATVPEKEVVSFLRDLGVPGACMLGSPQWQTPDELEGVMLYYTMTSSAVHSLCLTERWGGLADWVDRPNEYEAILHSNHHLGFSRLSDICTNDVPAIQSFLASIITDPYFFHRKEPLTSKSSSLGSPTDHGACRRFLSGDHLRGRPYAVVLEADALHIILPRIEKHTKKTKKVAPEPLPPPGAGGNSPLRPEAIHDVYVLRPSFSASRRLMCTITYLQSEPPDARRRLRRREESLPLPCTPKEIVKVIREIMEGQSNAPLVIDCLPCLGHRRWLWRRMMGYNSSSGRLSSASYSRPCPIDNASRDPKSSTSHTMSLNHSVNGPSHQENVMKAMELIAASRLLASPMFGRLVWDKMIGISDRAISSLLRSTVFPVELRLANAVTHHPDDLLDPSVLIMALQDLMAVPTGSRPRGFKTDCLKPFCLAMLEVISSNVSKEEIIRCAIRVIDALPMLQQACVEIHIISSVIRLYIQARAIHDGGLARRITLAEEQSSSHGHGDLDVHLYSFLLMFELPDNESDRDSDNEEDDSGNDEPSSTNKDDALFATFRRDEGSTSRSPAAAATQADTLRGGATDSQRFKTKMSFSSKLQRSGSARKVGSLLSSSAAPTKHESTPGMGGEKRKSSNYDARDSHLILNDEPETPKKARPMGVMRVPKLSITPAADSDGGGALNTGAGSTGSSRRPHSSSTGTMPYTTRSSRRYFANKAPTTNPQRGRTPSTYLSSTTRANSLSSSQFVMLDAVKGTPGSAMTDGHTEEDTGRSLPRLNALAKKLGQAYLASDLWVILEMHQREMSVSETSSPRPLGATTEPGSSEKRSGSPEERPDSCGSSSSMVLIPRDKRRSNILSPEFSFWVIRKPEAPLYSRDFARASDLVSCGSTHGAPVNLLTLMSALIGREPQVASPEDWPALAGLIVSELVWEKSVGPLPDDFMHALMSVYQLLQAHRSGKGGDPSTKPAAVTPPSTSAPPGTQECDPIISYVDKQLTALTEFQESVWREQKKLGVEAQGFMRKRWALLLRCVACERTMYAQILASHVKRCVTEGAVSWGLVLSVVAACMRCLNELKICKQSSRQRAARTLTALSLEEAGLAFWLLQALNHIFDYCNQLSSFSAALLHELATSFNYISTMRELFIALMWEVQASGGLELEIAMARGESMYRTPAVEKNDTCFCTSAAATRMQLALLSHVNRSMDMCRTTLRRYKRYEDGERAMENRRAVRDVVSFFRQLNYFFAVDMGKLCSLLTYQSPTSANYRSSFKSYTMGDRLCIPISAMWILSKMIAMDDDHSLMPQTWVDSVIFFHFTAFLMLYAGAKEDRKKMILCKSHLRMLLALASYRNPCILDKFFQLRVLNFFIQEINAEMLTGGATSVEESQRRPPETDGGTTSFKLSPVPHVAPLQAKKTSPSLSLALPIPATIAPSEEQAAAETSVVSPPPQQEESPPSIKVDDRVDGLVKLKSGRQRWFPARVTAVAPDGSFSLLYDDGDVEHGKDVTELRLSRSRKLVPSTSPCGRVTNNSSSASPMTLPQLPKALAVKAASLPNSLMISERMVSQEGSAPSTRLTVPALNSVAALPGRDSRGDKLPLLSSGSLEIHSVDSDSDADDTEIFDIAPALVPEGGGLRQSASLPVMKLQLADAMAAIRAQGGQVLTTSLSASLLYWGDEGMEPTPTASFKSGLGGDDRNEASGGTLQQSQSTSQHPPKLQHSSSLGDKYSAQRERIALYRDPQLQELAILLLLNLCISSDRLTLEPRYCTQFPSTTDIGGNEMAGSNVLFVLYCHLNHPENARIIPRLRAHVAHFGKAALRLLRLLCSDSFDARLYSHHKEKIAEGGFGTVMAVRSPVAMGGASAAYLDSPVRAAADAHLTVKLIGHEVSPYDRCVTFDVFSEISALEALRHSSHVCHLYDYGVSDNKFWLVMERCQLSLKTWRVEQMPLQPTDDHVNVYLQIFAKVLEAVHTLHDHNIAHFDLKCDNVLIRAMEGGAGSGTDPSSLNFSICIGDFGEAQIGAASSSADDLDKEEEEEPKGRSRVLQARGTEAVQSPEMVRIMALNRKDMAGYDRRRRRSVGCSSDVWSLGCLVYELLTGEFLFNSDWSHFFVQLTNPSFPMPPTDRMEPLKATLSPSVFSTIHKLLEYMLVREVERRPRLEHVRSQLQLLLQALTRKLRTYASMLPGSKEGGSGEGLGLLLTPPAPRGGGGSATAPSLPSPSTGLPPQLVDVWASQGEGEVGAGLWRLTGGAYLTTVNDWSPFFRSRADVNDVISDRWESPPGWDVDDDLKGKARESEEMVVFSAPFLPDLWQERQWVDHQVTRAHQLGVTKLVILVELDEKICKPSLPHAGVSLVEMKEAEKLILRASRRSTGTSTSKARTAASVDTSSPRNDSDHVNRSPTARIEPQGLLVFWKSSTAKEEGHSSEQMVIATLLETAKYTERIMDFMLKREDKEDRPVVAIVTAAGPRKALSNVLATALTTMYVMRESEVPLSLYEAILRVKSSYPNATFTRKTVACLSTLPPPKKGKDTLGTTR